MARAAAIVAAGAVLLVAAWLATRSGEKQDEPSPEARTSVPEPVPLPDADPAESGVVPAHPALEAPPEAEDEPPLPSHLAQIVSRYRAAETPEERERALLELALTDQPESLWFLLDELERADEAERQAVLFAVVQFASRDAVPRLREMALRASSEEEARRLTEAADYLELPSLTEFRRGMGEP